jgi:hypothetical protein
MNIHNAGEIAAAARLKLLVFPNDASSLDPRMLLLEFTRHIAERYHRHLWEIRGWPVALGKVSTAATDNGMFPSEVRIRRVALMLGRMVNLRLTVDVPNAILAKSRARREQQKNKENVFHRDTSPEKPSDIGGRAADANFPTPIEATSVPNCNRPK